MSQSILNFVSFLSGICGIVAMLLYFITVPKNQRTISLLITSVLIGLPLVLLLLKQTLWLFGVAVIVYIGLVAAFSFLYGRTKAEQKLSLLDLSIATNTRPNVQEWILENIMENKAGIVNIDAFGVKLDALYKLLKGSTYKSKLPQDAEISMRALILEPNCHGVNSRAKIEKNDRVVKDVELMKDVWIKLAKEYRKHLCHNLKVKTYDFTPSFYIVRVNDKMLVGTYLAESGYENLTLHLTRSDGKTFYQFERFFERIWLDCSKNVFLIKTAKPHQELNESSESP